MSVSEKERERGGQERAARQKGKAREGVNINMIAVCLGFGSWLLLAALVFAALRKGFRMAYTHMCAYV
jgi:hypothetical protein